MWNRLQTAIRLRQATAGMMGLMLGLLVNLASNWVDRAGPAAIGIVSILFVAFAVLSVWYWLRIPSHVEVRVNAPLPIRTDDEKQRAARKGVIAFVSLYRPSPQSTAKALSPAQWQDAAKENDYQRLDLMNSNLEPLIMAIKTHATSIEHCWLISTSNLPSDALASETPGSNLYVGALIEYLQKECALKCEFHCKGYEVPLNDDALVFSKTLELIQQKIHKEATELGLEPKDVIVDFTGGNRSLSLGAILASLDGARDIQLMGAHYGPDGTPTGGLYPIVFSFEVFIPEK